MTWFARGFAAVTGVLAAAAVVDGQLLLAASVVAGAVGATVSSAASRRQEAERQTAFTQRLRAARREPQGVIVVRRTSEDFLARVLPVWVDVDGEARGRLRSPGEESFAVSAGSRSVTSRRPWATGRVASVQVPANGTSVLDV